MSFDRDINQICPHLVAEEALYLSADRQTIRPLRPISSSTSVNVFLNHAVQVPSSGVQTSAKVTGVRRGPFTVSTGVNDTVQIIVNQGSPQTVMLPAVNKMSAIQVAGRLNQQLTGVTFSVVNESLSVSTVTSGPGSSILFTAASTASPLFGINVNREFRGQQLVPGWTLVTDPTTLADRPTRLVVFDTPLRSDSNFVELSYSTIREECRRCGGSGFENDWRFDVNGKQIEIRDEDLLIQELQKAFYTIRGSNPFHADYGTGLIEAIGKKLSAGGFTQNLIVADIHQQFNQWQGIKKQQEESVGQPVSDREFPLRLLSVNIQQSSSDPTVIFVDITVQNRSNDPIQLTRGLKIPQALQLATSPVRALSAG